MCFLAVLTLLRRSDVCLVIVANVVYLGVDNVIVCLFIFQSEDDDSTSVTASSVTVSV